MARKRERRERAAPQVVAGRVLLAAVLAAAVGIVAVLAWAGISAARALPHVERAQQVAANLEPEAVLSGDTSQLDELQGELALARGRTSGPVWSLAEEIPWVGPQFHATRTLTETLDDFAGDGLAAASRAGEGLDALQPRDGRIDVAAISDLDAEIQAALVSVSSARERVDSLDPRPLVGPLREGTAQVDGLLAELEPTLEGTARATALLPGFLGAEGEREHLLLLQNNAEWRSQGGIVGQVIQITAVDGEIDFTDQIPGADFQSRDEAITPLEFETEMIFGDRPARYMQNPTMIPDFAEGAQVAREFWMDEEGGSPSGAIATDPVALSYILEATGPVELPTGDVLTSDNVVDLLLNEVYLRYEDPAEQDVFFAVASDAIFDALLGGDADPAASMQAITRAIDERRLLVWSADEEEQALLEGTQVAGEMPSSDDETTAFGVYFNEGGGTKLNYYMAAGSRAAWCGDGTAALQVGLRNDAPEDITEYPDYLLAAFDGAEETASGVPRGITRTVAHIYLPEGAELGETPDEAQLIGEHGGRPVLEWTSDLAPGEDEMLNVRVRPRTGSTLDIVSTPVLEDFEVPTGC
ncbi:DUF4012 domain-containing protein [Nesterenkonia populi]|uniref:DUF4012 domain-containing protein n=1 Tax=Nesterenkonia populi TaxID=1591087 RepID=UPI001478B6DD|nr:DUF4012 domain-containing protein [Nesterenkonia populi]